MKPMSIETQRELFGTLAVMRRCLVRLRGEYRNSETDGQTKAILSLSKKTLAKARAEMGGDDG